MNEDPNDQDYIRRRQEIHLQEEMLRLQQEEHRLANAQRNAKFTLVMNGIYFLVGALEVLLALRFCLRLLGANRDNTFAQVIYGFSEPFVAPFSTLFVSPVFGHGSNIFDVNLLIAIAVYAILGGLTAWLVWFIGNQR